MATKTYTIAVLVAERTNYQGDIYTIETPESTDFVIVNGEHITCSCHEQNCCHISAVIRRRAQNAASNARRDVA